MDKDIFSEDIKGENVSASYNSNYFLDGISHILSENRTSFTQNNRPMFIKDAKDESFTYLLMPL